MIYIVDVFDGRRRFMADTAFEVHVPRVLLQYGIDQREVQRRLNEWLVLSLFTDGHISSGKAAQLLGISRLDFLALLRTRGVAYINYTPDELAEEFAAVDALRDTANP
jgi:predicted HTH domain antitoxin